MSAVAAVRVASLVVQGTALALVIFTKTAYPTVAEKSVRARARARGWPKAVLFFARAFMHFTIQSAVVLVMALALTLAGHRLASLVKTIAFSFQTMVGVAYHTLISIDPFLIIERSNFNNPERAARQLFSWTVPTSRSFLPVWLILHIQHLLAPLHFWFELLFFPSSFDIEYMTLGDEFKIVFGSALAYGVHNMCSWAIRHEPPYPVQRMVWRKGFFAALTFYLGFLLVLGVLTVVCRAARLHMTIPEEIF